MKDDPWTLPSVPTLTTNTTAANPAANAAAPCCPVFVVVKYGQR